MCSTPYGNQRKITTSDLRRGWAAYCAQRLTAIRGKSQRYYGLPLGVEGVLNALRQSEENHRGHARDWGMAMHVLNALRQSEENHGLTELPAWLEQVRAQRLTAIRGKSREQLVYSRAAAARCSTPYGNQRKITLPSGLGGPEDPCAQRLTAIRGKSQRGNKGQ